jgi:ribosomal protein S18 acetylase RimI-like enzyme
MSLAVRLATIADHPAFARLFPELGVEDPLPSAAEFAERMLPRVVVVDEVDGPGQAPGRPPARARGAVRTVGYASWRCYGRTLHVVNVVVDASERGRGVGAALMGDLRERAAMESCTRWYLNVKQDNAPALRLYGRFGMEIEREGWGLHVAWEQLSSLPGPSRAARAPAPEEDATLAARLDVDAERIALARARPGSVVRAIYDDDGTPAAVAAFDPAYPGVYPVRVSRADLARPLFESLRFAARHERVNVFVEGDRPLYEALRSVGAELRHAVYRMGASL